MNRRINLAALFLGLLVAAGAIAEERRALPNVVFFLADDLGDGDVGVYGGVVPGLPGQVLNSPTVIGRSGPEIGASIPRLLAGLRSAPRRVRARARCDEPGRA